MTTKSVKVALLGFGTVGSSVAKVLATGKFQGIELTHIYNRDVARKQASPAAKFAPKTVLWTENIQDILTSDVDIVIELMGGLDPVEGWLRKAIASGKSVVTANKQLIAYRGAGLARLAKKHGVQLIHGAAVGRWRPRDPRPAPGPVRRPDHPHPRHRQRHMQLHPFEDGGRCRLRRGPRRGPVPWLRRSQPLRRTSTASTPAPSSASSPASPSRAELDPEQVPTQSISAVQAIDFAYAKELGCTIRQIATAELAGAPSRLASHPCSSPTPSPWPGPHGTQNMVVVSGRFGGDVVFSGHGAGGEPTAVAVVSDLLAIAHGHASVELPVKKRVVTGDFMAPHYLRSSSPTSQASSTPSPEPSPTSEPTSTRSSSAPATTTSPPLRRHHRTLPQLHHGQGRQSHRQDGTACSKSRFACRSWKTNKVFAVGFALPLPLPLAVWLSSQKGPALSSVCLPAAFLH